MPLHYQTTFGSAISKMPREVEQSDKKESCPKQVTQHANTMEKSRNREELLQDEANFIHNTTGNQDRKRRKIVMSGNKNFENQTIVACPKIGQFRRDPRVIEQPDASTRLPSGTIIPLSAAPLRILTRPISTEEDPECRDDQKEAKSQEPQSNVVLDARVRQGSQLDQGDLLQGLEGHRADGVPGIQVGLGSEEQEDGG